MNKENLNRIILDGGCLPATSGVGAKTKRCSYIPVEMKVKSLELEKAFLSLSVIDISSVSVTEYEDGFSGSSGSDYDIIFD